ncbi:MAG: hypothetical protein HKN43_16370 [Rhodothermales bacterium]|nr:hypothetical protein [Rhodothermales bacterium]
MIKLLLFIAVVILIMRFVNRPGGPDQQIKSGKGKANDSRSGVEDAVWEDVS